jgi:hypothetical protein
MLKKIRLFRFSGSNLIFQDLDLNHNIDIYLVEWYTARFLMTINERTLTLMYV